MGEGEGGGGGWGGGCGWGDVQRATCVWREVSSVDATRCTHACACGGEGGKRGGGLVYASEAADELQSVGVGGCVRVEEVRCAERDGCVVSGGGVGVSQALTPVRVCGCER